MAETSRLFARGSVKATAPALPVRKPKRAAVSNQALLRRRSANHGACSECEEKARSGRAQTSGTGTSTSSSSVAVARRSSVNVWGLPVTRSMCGCAQTVRDDIAWANTAAATYTACNTVANATGTDVEACFKAAHPTAVVVAETDTSGVMTLPAASADPCQRIADKATLVHETMHSRHAADMARAQGPAFYAEWQRLRGDPAWATKMRVKFAGQVDAFLRQWDNGSDWASDEVRSYTWERRFLEDALRAINEVCG